MASLTKYLFISLLFVVILHISVFSQKLDLQNVEQINLITDRTLYISGELIWYSARYSIPSDTSLILSKVLYVELFDNEKKVISTQKNKIDNGIINGRIIIPEHIASGYYILRVYTRYQKNFPSWQFTSVIIRIVNPGHPLPPILLPSKNDQTKITLMPNGNIAFKIKQPLTKEIDSISLLVNNQYISAKGLYYSNGLGSFNYKAVSNDSISLLIIIKSGDSIISEPYVVDSAFAKIPIEEIAEGLSLLSVKNIKGNNIAQSMRYFPKEVINQNLVTADNSVFSGDPISINLSGIDSSEYPLAVSMIIKGSNTCNSHLLPNYLIENPLYISGFLSNYTFLDDELLNQVHIAIVLEQENLLNLFNEDYEIENMIIPEIYGLTLNGKIVNQQTNKPISNELVYTSVLGSELQFHAATTSQDGSFLIPLNFCNNQQDIYIATNTSDENKLDIQIEDGFCSIPPPWHSSPFILDTSCRELITQMYLNYQISNVFNVQYQQIIENITVSLPIFGDNLIQIKLSDFIQMSTTPEVFNELVPNVRARKKDGNYKLIVFDDYLNLKYENPLILVDNMPYNNIDKLMELQPTEIEQIYVINHEYMYGNNLFKGIIVITTNTGNFAKLPLSQNGAFVEYQTLEPDVKFIPFNSSQNASEKPDFSNTVYWNSFNYDDKIMQLQITAPSSIAEYELTIVSLANQPLIIEQKEIRITKKPMSN